MRIVFLSFNFAEYCVRLASALARDAEVLLMLPEKEADPYLGLLDGAVNFQPFAAPRLRQPIQQMKLCTALCRRIKDFGPQVIHFQHWHLWFNLALTFLPHCGFVLTVHDYRAHPGDKPSSRTPQFIVDLGIRRADEIIVHAQHVKQLVVGNYRIPDSRVHVIPLIKLGQQEGIADSSNQHPPTVLFFGRIWEYKGLEYLIRAEPLITSLVPEARIVIAGQGEDFARYRRMMVHPERFVVYNKHVSDSERAELFRQATVVTLPYIEASQSAIIPVAYAHAKPVVATAVGGLPEMVDNGRTGFCVPPRDEK